MPEDPCHAVRRSHHVLAMLRAVAGRAMLVLMGIMLGLGALEVGARWRFGRPLPLEGDSLDLPKLGFRYGRHRVAKDPMVLRIVGIGDSFAYGVVQPSFNYHHLIEKALARRLARPLEVINLGKPGAGPAEELAILGELGLQLDPDIVMWTFFVGNDLHDARKTPADAELSLREVLQRDPTRGFLRGDHEARWYDRLRLVSYGRFLITYLKGYGVPGVSLERDGGTMTPSTFFATERTRMELLLNDREARRLFHGAVAPRLRTAVRLCEQAEVPFVLIVAPDQVEVESMLAREILVALRARNKLEHADLRVYEECFRKGDVAPMMIAHDLVTGFAEEQKVWFLDLRQEFRRRGRDGGLYALRDTHWNRKGNELAARLITNTLVTVARSRNRGTGL